MSIEKLSFKELLNLKIQVLLADYQQRQEVILRCIDNQSRGIQVFLTGTFLLIAYTIVSTEYLLFLTVPVILFVLFNFLLHYFRVIYIHAKRCIEIERKTGKLLNDDRILCWEREYGGMSRKWRESKTYRVNYTLLGTMGAAYLFFSILALYHSYYRLGFETMCVFAIIFTILLIISISNSLNVFKLRPPITS